MSKRLSFKEALEQRERGQTASRPRTAFPTVKAHLRRTDPIRRPVDLARQLVLCGVSLRKAHEAVNRLAEGKTVALELGRRDFDQSVDQLAKLGIGARRVTMPMVNPRYVREIYGLTQVEFADRFLLNVDTIRNWEQERNTPDPSARLLLKIIEDYPQIVEAVLLNEHVPLQGGPYRFSLSGASLQTQVAVQNYNGLAQLRGETALCLAAHFGATLNARIETNGYSWMAREASLISN
jgi:DNA-binding transcriptional regulator YiaG